MTIGMEKSQDKEGTQMNDQTQSTALALPEPTTLATMFKAENGLDPLLNKIKADALNMVKDLDPAVKKDRELMKSAANKVSLSKAEIDRRGKDLTEAQRREVNAVNAGRKVAEAFLSALRDQVRKPADDWEAAEATRVDGHKAALAKFDEGRVDAFADPDAIKDIMARATTFYGSRDWQEFAPRAKELLEACTTKWQRDLDAAEARVAREAELEVLRAEKAARDEADRLRAEAEAREALRIEAEKREAERLRLEAEKAEADRVAAEKAEADRIAKIEADKLAAAKAAQEQAEARAKAEAERSAQAARDREAALLQAQADADARHANELADARAREEAAAQAERDRLEAQMKAEADARAKREADQAHRARIKADIAAALASMAGSATPDAIADALICGKIPHVTVVM